MSSGTISPVGSEVAQQGAKSFDRNRAVWTALRWAGSLQITVWGFALAILILFVGTLAQDEETIVDVKRDYFNSWIAYVPLDVFKPITIWPESDFPRWPYGLVLPGGATIGLVLLINLIAAKLTRFHMTAKGGKLVAGLAFCLVGATITAVVILGAHAEDGLQGEPPFKNGYETLWQLTRGTIILSTLALCVFWSIHKFKTTLGQIVVLVVAALMGFWSLALLIYPEALRIPDPGLRIVWQMSKSLIAGGIILVGLNLLFGRRGGNVLIHLSIGLLMLGQFIFGDRQIEERIMIADGQKTSMALRIDEAELAFIDGSDAKVDRVVAIDEAALLRASRSGNRIVDPAIPFQIAVSDYFVNSNLVTVKNDDSIANSDAVGLAKQVKAVAAEKVGGAKEGRNTPAAYIELFYKDGKKSLGKYLVAVAVNDSEQLTFGMQPNFSDEVSDGDKSYRMGLRMRRSYKDYEIYLKDVQRNDYANSEMVKDFSSYVTISNPDGSEPLEGRIWMNNPMRYRGETFYQSDYYSAEDVGVDTTGLQVVKNAGWLMPYIACAFAALGMLGHFGGTFVRFASRFDRERGIVSDAQVSESTNPFASSVRSASVDKKPTTDKLSVSPLSQNNIWTAASKAREGLSGVLLPLITVILVGGMFAYYAMPPRVPPTEFNWYAAGQLPVQHEGRIKPLDSVARNTLQALSGRTSTVVRAADIKAENDRKVSATEWFLSLVAESEWVEHAKIFRIDAKEVLDFFDLDPEQSGGTLGTREKLFGQTGRQRYSIKQLEPKLDGFFAAIDKIREKQKANRDSLRFADQKFLELYQKLNIYQLVKLSYGTSVPRLPSDLENEESLLKFRQQIFEEFEAIQSLEAGKPPAMLPPTQSVAGGNEEPWRALRPVLFANYTAKTFAMDGVKEHPAVMPLVDVIDAVRDKNGESFNKMISHYATILETIPASKNAIPKASFEAWYNKFGAINGCIAFYIIAAICGFLSLIVWHQPLRRIAFWITLVVFCIHVIAIIGRIYITERAPVINLYSSAVYIGCGAVLFGLVLEYLYPIRIGLLVGSLIGCTSLLVAYGLDTSDTMPVLQAVLDTQFWLTTHVQAITAGYLATFVAGGIAIAAIIHRSIFRKSLRSSHPDAEAVEIQRILFRITYGVICFAIFFSLIGTVLGGLWADDSWGRFWGWDPKENGALMIVLWNAIVLHARWDKLVRERGFALLCIGGNIITAWSWFGTNQLGIGLHSYGFTSTVLAILGWFVLSQLAIIVVGYALTFEPKNRSTSAEPVGSWE